MKYLVTGGAGFIGSHLVSLLKEKGHDVIVLDNLSSGRRDWIQPGIEFIEGDIRDLKTCERVVDGIHVIIHLAAMSRSGPSIDMIDFCNEVNVHGTLNLLKVAKETGVKKFIYAASSTHYGNSPPPQKVENKPDLLNPYGLTKHVGELWVNLYSRLYSLNTTSLRFFNVYGPRQPHDGVYGLVIGIFLKALAAGEPLLIHGDGKQRRDFVHVYDVANALYLASLRGVNGKTYNVGSGKNFSVKELANIISVNQLHVDRREGDAEVTLAEIEETIADLGWTPSVELENGIKQMKGKSFE